MSEFEQYELAVEPERRVSPNRSSRNPDTTVPGPAPKPPDGHAERKRTELGLLNDYLRAPVVAPARCAATELARLKVVACASHLAQSVLDHQSVRETNLQRGAVVNLGPYRLSWSYQRFDLAADGLHPYRAVLAKLPQSAFSSTAGYTASGMSSITCLLLALNRIASPLLEFVAVRDAYFETLRAVETLTDKLHLVTVDHPGDLAASLGTATVVLVDSIGRGSHVEDLEEALARRPRLVLFDTTCYLDDSAAIGEVVTSCLRKRVPLVLVRSHIKLDGLGVEYGRLGSAVFVVASDTEPAVVEEFVELIGFYEDAVAKTGAAANPFHLIPYFGSARYAELNRARVRHIRANNSRLCRALVERAPHSSFVVTGYHHQLFVTLDAPVEGDIEELRAELDELAAQARAIGVPARHAASFGLDTVHLDVFLDLNRGGRTVVRVSMSDVPAAAVVLLSDLLVQWWSERRDRASASGGGLEACHG